MGTVAIIFPGQGSQQVGMGKAAHDALPVVAETFAEADEALGFELSKMCFEGPEDQLRMTENTQPAILTTSIALWRALEIPCERLAGHSLGEWTAHVAAGTLPFSAAVKLVRARGRYMQEAVPAGEGAMAAILKAELEVVNEVCATVEGVVEAVNLNAPGQIVIAGATAAVEAAGRALREKGARVAPLPVSAPFHSSLMKPAEERLAADLRDVALNAPCCPVYVNVDAAPVTTADAARDALLRQVSRPVRWTESIQRMIADGTKTFIEVGHGKVLRGLVSRIDRSAQIVNVQGPDDLDAARRVIEENA